MKRSFMLVVDAYQRKHGCTRTEALKAIAKSEAALYDEFLKNQKNADAPSSNVRQAPATKKNSAFFHGDCGRIPERTRLHPDRSAAGYCKKISGST